MRRPPTAPTHNLTLTRTALELLETDSKLRDSLPGYKLPKLPIDAAALPAPPPKRKSAFLNTLSRLASPSGKSAAASARPQSRRGSSAGGPSSAASPVVSPAQEVGDPFDGIRADGGAAEQYTAANSTVTGLAAYLTSVANDPGVRQTKVWRRFVRVRTDDLQSVRAERAIKRVRSDLAAHSSPSHAEGPLSLSQVLGEAESAAVSRKSSAGPSVNGTTEAVEDHTVETVQPDTDAKAEESVVNGHVDDGASEVPQSEEKETEEAAEAAKTPVAAKGEQQAEAKAPVPEGDDQDEGRSTPVPESSASRRLPRSQSAEPTNRGSRIYNPNVSSTLRGQSSQASMTGDESSISTTGRRSSRKKRSKSTDPNASTPTHR